jgi:deoxyguanosine kinase
MAATLISIIGPPASGKTTLAESLCAQLAAEMVREDYAGNPFLADSYLGKEEARLPGQLYFLVSRAGQLSRASWPARGVRVSDYGFCQDRIFAQLKLGADELAIYEPLRARLENLVHPPDLLIRLTASPRVLLGRIAARGRGFERVMTAEFLETIDGLYARAAAEAKCEVLAVDTGQTDFRADSNVRELANTVRQLIGQKRLSPQRTQRTQSKK